jgi:hypothetical protein
VGRKCLRETVRAGRRGIEFIDALERNGGVAVGAALWWMEQTNLSRVIEHMLWGMVAPPGDWSLVTAVKDVPRICRAKIAA